MEKAKNNYKNSVFRWSSKNVKNQTNGFFQKLLDTSCVRKGEKRAVSCTLSVLAKNFFWPKTVQTRKHYKIVVSVEIAQNQK